MQQLPVEGFFIVTVDNLVFEVKGVVHPKNRLIAYLRYVPDVRGDRTLANGKKYRKLYPLDDRVKYLERNNPEYLWFDEKRDRQFQSVPIEQVSFVLNPVEGLRELRDMGFHLTPLQEATRILAEELVRVTGIDWQDLGMTGSQLVGLATETSDIDLVVYGESSALQLHSKLSNESIQVTGLRAYSGKSLDRHLEFRWGGHEKWMDKLRSIEAQKVLQGTFNSYDFFIRAVKLPEEIDHEYGDYVIREMGRCTLRCVVLCSDNAIFTPCVYEVGCEDSPKLQKLISYRGRFTEHVSSGMIVEVSGRLESVINIHDSNKFLQIVLGEDSRDYLVPL